MNNEDNTNYGLDVNLICEFFMGMDRQGPGSPDMTVKALSFIEGLDERSRIADLGCGTGGQTMTLAEACPAQITAIDNYPGFIDKLNHEVRAKGLQARVNGLVGTMEEPPFEPGSLDLIWCEGAIYNIGFERGIRLWYPLLKEGGYLALTESCWLTEERPKAIHAFWMEGYPEIGTILVKQEQLKQAGYQLVSTFVLPESCWTDNYYQPIATWKETFRAKHPGNRSVEELLRFLELETNMYRRYQAYYGYVFFIAKKC